MLGSKLYPPIEPYVQHSLQVDSTHSLHIEECGNPNGIPILFVHGGPGGGYSVIHRQFFNPHAYRIVLFDQRGCGRSRPHACLTNNTSAHLMEDIEKIRRYLNIDKWVLFGGSWGSTLSLLYAQSYPERVLGLILRGIFLCREQDVNWFYQQGADRFYPEYWQDFIAPIAPEKRDSMVEAYYEILTSKDEVARMRAAEAWSVWEGRTCNLQTDEATVNYFGDPFHALAMARIECHYFRHQAFIEDNQILDNCHSIRHLPITIVHGRYDMVCPVNQAFELAERLPQANLIICNHAGHSAMETEISHQLITTTDAFIELLEAS
ncbi:proline iminopeptidase [Thiosulfatimonas sediminis]|uniref:Proline iminopeptidase n=1 Tax=Thiosulfatimonas sediminis TaxID=2675054 RepID=A0A6F8PS24_9GAMM|nr:prolyl aminopeptidase [Thiosulfatimonas sediminis]BBP44834.1 proline iminopeptidase [Thiosulfatimonas sediminis]